MLYYNTLKQVGAGVRRHHEHHTRDVAFSISYGHPLWRPLMKLCQGVARRGEYLTAVIPALPRGAESVTKGMQP
jgi:hypothetical protein